MNRLPSIAAEVPIKSFEKRAFRAAYSAFRKAIPYARNLAGKYAPTFENVNRFGNKIEGGISRGVGRVLGPQGRSLSNKLLKGTVGESARQAVTGAGIGGLLEGGLGAAFADEGQRGDAFLSGLRSGATSGAAFGALGGMVGQPIRNLRQSALTEAARLRGLSPAVATKSMDQGFFKNLKSLATGRGEYDAPLNRQLAGINALGQAGQFAGEMYLPTKILPTPATPPPDEMKYASTEEPNAVPAIPPVLLGSVGGSTIGGIATDLLKESPRFPAGYGGKILSRAIPAAGALTGAYLGLQQMPPKSENLQAVEDVDFDKLLRYYRKRKDSPA